MLSASHDPYDPPRAMSLAVPRHRMPYPTPPAGAPLRLAFVGQETFFRACALEAGDVPGVETLFVDFRAGADADAMLGALRAFAPHVVVVFRPEIVPAGRFAELRAATLGFLTEPLPRTGPGAPHPDLARRLEDMRGIDRANFDRIVAFDPLIAESADAFMPVWRSLPLPVADRCYAPVRPAGGRPGVMFVGRSTEHRERFLVPCKHEWDILHVAFGADLDRLIALMREHHVGINLHNEPYPSFENRVCLHLAAGHLVLSEPLDPTHGLEPGLDYLEVSLPGDLLHHVERLNRFPDYQHRVRVRGRQKAEQYRASRVWPRLVEDLLLDLRAFGTERAA